MLMRIPVWRLFVLMASLALAAGCFGGGPQESAGPDIGADADVNDCTSDEEAAREGNVEADRGQFNDDSGVGVGCAPAQPASG